MPITNLNIMFLYWVLGSNAYSDSYRCIHLIIEVLDFNVHLGFKFKSFIHAYYGKAFFNMHISKHIMHVSRPYDEKIQPYCVDIVDAGLD